MRLIPTLAAGEGKLVFIVAALPCIYMICQGLLSLQGMPNTLGSDPGKALTGMSGIWTLRFILIVLFITPLRGLFQLKRLPRFRRMLGLYAFFYANLHLFCYLTFMLQWRLADLAADFLERPYISMGILALILLIPLAVSSNRSMMVMLGKSWKRLHQLLYLIVILALIHLIWQTRGDFAVVFLYTGLAALALGYRVVIAIQRASEPEKSR